MSLLAMSVRLSVHLSFEEKLLTTVLNINLPSNILNDAIVVGRVPSGVIRQSRPDSTVNLDSK